MNLLKLCKKMSLGLAGLTLGLAASSQAGHTNTVLVGDLNGQEEVAADPMDADKAPGIAGDWNGNGVAYVFGIDNDPTTLCYVLLVDDILLIDLAAHIHEGPVGVNGPVIASLAGPEAGDAADCLTEGEPGKFPTGETGIVQRILERPQRFYVNVHNIQFPGGAIRAQLQHNR